MGLIITAGFLTFLAGLATVLVFFANGMRSSPGEFIGRGFLWFIWILAALIWGLAVAHAHDHNHAQLNPWLQGLTNKNRALCCSGDDTDAIQDWDRQGDHFRVKFRDEW